MNLRDSMGILLAGAVLLLLCMAGVAWIVLSRDLFTVDGLFMVLILLTMTGAIAFELLYELRQKEAPETTVARARAGSGTAGTQSSAGTLVESGLVEKAEFYEAPVGQPNKTVVSLKSGSEARWITFEGNVLHLLPQGHKVRIVYRPGPLNVLVDSDRA